MKEKKVVVPFTAYQKLVIFLLAMTQFTVILDFMVMSPLGDMMMKDLSLTPAAFGVAVSAYAFSAGVSGLLTAGFADRFDRKKILLFFYCGFIAGTVFCGIAHTYEQLITARIITGLFGGVISSVSLAIITDIFSMQQRGRVMGFIQMGFGASQVLGVPIGLYLANARGWEAPFLLVAALAFIIMLLIVLRFEPVVAHLALQKNQSPLKHLWHTLSQRNYRIGFSATALLSIGGFMMMPFGSAFAINNLKVSQEHLPLMFMISGITALIIMPLIGRLSDRINKYKIFFAATVWMMIVCVLYTNLGPSPFWLVIIFNIVMMIGIMSRMIPAGALTSAVPDMRDRGAFMSINSSLQQIAGGIAAAVAGNIVVQKAKAAPLEHYNIVGYVIVGISALSLFLMYRVSEMIRRKYAAATPVVPSNEDVMEVVS